MKLTMEKAVYGGDCLARDTSASGNAGKTIAGKTVFIPLTLPGETVSAHIIEEKRSFARAEADEIVAASPQRVTPQCPHFGACGGCHYQHAEYAAQLGIKQQILRETLARSGVAVPSEIGVLSGNPWGYRNRIRLALTQDGKPGYRGRRSHEIVPIRECPIAAPLLAEVALNLASIIDPSDPRNDLAEIELFTNHDGSELLVTFHLHSGNPIHRKLRFTPRYGSAHSQATRSKEDCLTYCVAGHDYRVSHGAFFQVNRWLLDGFVALVTANRSGSLAWDLYAGVGLFTRPLAAYFARVLAVESAPASFDALQHNLAGTSGTAIGSTTLDFLRRNREQRESGPDLIVLDPPRAGLGEETTRLLNAIGAPEMVYVSCDPTTLARDLRALTGERYKIEKITLVDMFPQTFHLETVVHLRRC